MLASPFEVVYDSNPNGPLDLVTIPTANRFSIDEEIRDKEIQKMRKKFFCQDLKK